MTKSKLAPPPPRTPPTPRVLRCACYTRKSTEEGLEQEFNSLDAQREAGEAFIKSQCHEGWQCLAARYDDGGFTGANMERPALQRLLADIQAGHVDCVVVYKVDRLSRSLLDFARMMETFEKHHIAFVSVTQQFNTASSMGRLVLNVLLSFAQFEREIISERTRDKIAATRRKGKWSGGLPILGYDVDEHSKLIVNEGEAQQVRAIFTLYLKHQGLIPVVQELQRRGWVNKRWTTRKGHPCGGKLFTKTSLHHLLTNVAYVGKVKYKSEVHPGEHTAIVAPALWERVQTRLRQNHIRGAGQARNPEPAPLRGLLRCAPCGCAMCPSHTSRQGVRRYRYYTCSGAQKRGWHTCPSKAVPAGELERLILDQIRRLGPAPTGVAQADAAPAGAAPAAGAVPAPAGAARKQSAEQVWQSQALRRDLADWEILPRAEQTRLFQLLLVRVDYDGSQAKIAITFNDAAIQTLTAATTRQMTNPFQEK